ncbi:SMC-Scp complex subunit ScpB [Candidatus Kaiserbacteria bacterium]|nr:MAG: SMC-Scp complex subunit ScpB [Candidatus Kaiserbacteria bacterium]
MELNARIEAILFYKTEPMSLKALAVFLSVSIEEVTGGLATLANVLQNRGIRLLTTDTSVQLITAPEASELIEQLRKDELSTDIGKAGAETLAIVLYRGPLSRVEIDRVRGVNSAFILRNLLIRGLVERRAHPTDSRSFIYAVTPSLLQHLGITAREEMQDFAEVMNAIDVFEEQSIAEEQTSNPITE